MTKTPTRLSVTSEPSVPPPLLTELFSVFDFLHLIHLLLSIEGLVSLNVYIWETQESFSKEKKCIHRRKRWASPIKLRVSLLFSSVAYHLILPTINNHFYHWKPEHMLVHFYLYLVSHIVNSFIYWQIFLGCDKYIVLLWFITKHQLPNQTSSRTRKRWKYSYNVMYDTFKVINVRGLLLHCSAP